MEAVTVIGTKTERKISEVAGSVSVLDEEYIERQLIQDIADLVKYEPGVSVAGNENLLSTLYGTDIVVENNKTVGRLVIHS